MKFYIIIVLYNQFAGKSKVIDGVFSCDVIFIADNSTDENILEKNKDFCLEHKIKYIPMNGNKGLSVAYNRVISEIPVDGNSWIVLCDQDTEISSAFISQYKKAISENPGKQIFCPIVKDSKGIMSPSRIQGKKYGHSKLTDFNIDIEKYSFINSCMCVNSLVFQDIRYDESLFLDFVDHDFVNAVRIKYAENKFYVINDLQVYQNFSGVTKNSVQSDFARFKIYISDAYWYYGKWYKTKRGAFPLLLVRAIKLSIVHKRIRFLTLLFGLSR